mmetsp:Transcript_6543/g.19306  ORF Transcript_6543/g.19306 Transcript_6543/m.19306 type:complete len:205 (-) Transcript_6543:1510-2124(-)
MKLRQPRQPLPRRRHARRRLLHPNVRQIRRPGVPLLEHTLPREILHDIVVRSPATLGGAGVVLGRRSGQRRMRHDPPPSWKVHVEPIQRPEPSHPQSGGGRSVGRKGGGRRDGDEVRLETVPPVGRDAGRESTEGDRDVEVLEGVLGRGSGGSRCRSVRGPLDREALLVERATRGGQPGKCARRCLPLIKDLNAPFATLLIILG